uniref:Uncharacterized protein n=2 Tax=Kalanchoe fedtschenkoi TaxID=63787 RepID=A0A7N0RBH4_KALFE
MPRSSRHKSKRSVKDAREYSDTEEDVSKGKHRDEKEEGGSSRGYKEFGSGSGEKRKLASRTVVVKESSSHGNGYSSEEYAGAKRRKDKFDGVGSDRWNGSGEMLDLGSETREESFQLDEKALKSKGLIDLKSKVSSGRHDVEKKEETVGSFIGKEENRMVKVESKRRSDKDRSEKDKLDRDFDRKDYYKDAWDKERGSDRDNKFVDSKRDLDYQAAYGGEQKVNKGVESKDWALEDDFRRHESEKERERRRRKRTDEYDDMDRYQERDRDTSDINVKSRREREKDARDRDERDKDISCRDKHLEYYDRDHKGRDGEKREGTDRERTHKIDEYRNDSNYRDYTGNKNDSKYPRDEADALDSRLKKSRTDNSNHDSSVMYDDQSSRYNDYKETGRSMDKEDYSEIRAQSGKEHLELEKRSSGAREDTVSERERSRSFHPEEQSKHKRSPSSTAHSTRDLYRHSKQSETKYREHLLEERSRNNLNYGKEGNGSGASDRAHSSRSIVKSVQKGDSGFVADLSSERNRNTDRRASPMQFAEKSLSPLSSERRHHNRIGDRRSLDYDDAGHRNIGYKDSNYQFHDGKRSQDARIEASPMDDASQVDGDNLPVPSLYARSARMPGSSRSLLPPPSPLKHGIDNSYVVGSSEEDGRNKLNNRPKRLIDSSMGRIQGNAWRGAPNWPSPMANGFLPFPHGPPAVGFHPMMPQFPPQMFGVRPSMDHNGVPYHITDVDRFPGYGRPFGWPNPGDESCPSPMQSWDSNNMVLGEGYMQGRLDWDQNRSLVASASREPSVDRLKGSNSGTMESPSNCRRNTGELADDFSSQSNRGSKSELGQSHHQVDKAGSSNLFGSKVSSDMSASIKEVSDTMSIAKFSADIKKNVDRDDYVQRSCVYLSKIDISAYLANSGLFDKCVSLLRTKQNAVTGAVMSKFHLEEESDVVGGSSTTNTCISDVPVFSGVDDSLMEKAISLYRQHRDDVVANSLSSPSKGNQALPSREIQGSGPGTDGRVSLASSQSGEASGLKPARDGHLSEFPGLSNNEEKTAKSVICSQLVAPSPTSHGNLDKDVEKSSEVQINPISTSEEVSEGLFSVEIPAGKKRTVEIAGIDAAEGMKTVEKTSTEAVEETTFQSPNNAPASNAECTNEASAPAKDDYGRKEVDDEQAADISATGDPTLSRTSSVPFEVCEDIMMTELNEFGSVNLSRIHQSPESTH